MIHTYSKYINENLLKGRSEEDVMKNIDGKPIVDIIELYQGQYKTFRSLPIYRSFLNNDLDITDEDKIDAISSIPSNILEMGSTDDINLIITDILDSSMFDTFSDDIKSNTIFWLSIFTLSYNGDADDIIKVKEYLDNNKQILDSSSMDNISNAIFCGYNDLVEKYINIVSPTIHENDYPMDWDLYDYGAMCNNIDVIKIIIESEYNATKLDDIQHRAVLYNPKLILTILNNISKYSDDINDIQKYITKATTMLKIKE